MKTTSTILVPIVIFTTSITNLFAQPNSSGCNSWVNVYTSGLEYFVNGPVYDTTYVIAYPWDAVTIYGAWSGGCTGGNSGSLYHLNSGTSVTMNAPCIFPITVSGNYMFFYNVPLAHIVNVQFIQPTGLEEQVADQILVWPNPVIDDINVKTSLEGYEVFIIDINGRIVKSFMDNHFNTTIQTTDLPGGVYQMLFRNEKVAYSKSFMKL